MTRKFSGFIAICLGFAVISVFGAGHAAAAPATPTPPAITLDSIFQETQNCSRVRGFCRGRWGGGPQFRRCVRNRGCRVGRRLTYCQRTYRRCSRSFVPGRAPFARCMRRNGC